LLLFLQVWKGSGQVIEWLDVWCAKRPSSSTRSNGRHRIQNSYVRVFAAAYMHVLLTHTCVWVTVSVCVCMCICATPIAFKGSKMYCSSKAIECVWSLLSSLVVFVSIRVVLTNCYRCGRSSATSSSPYATSSSSTASACCCCCCCCLTMAA